MDDEIDTVLNSYHAATLSEMASAAGLDVMQGKKKLPKSQLLLKLRSEFFTQKRVLNSYHQLTDRDRAVLDRVMLRGGTVPTRALRRETVRAKLTTTASEHPQGPPYVGHIPYAQGYIGHPARTRSFVFEDTIARLTFHGLLFSRDPIMTTGGTIPYKIQFHPASTLYVPEVVRRYLPIPEPLPPELSTWEPSRVEPGDASLLLRDLYLYWDFVRRNKVPLLQSGLVGKRALKALNAALLIPDPTVGKAGREDEAGRLGVLRQLLERLGLIRASEGQLQPADKDPLHVPLFWSWPMIRQIKATLDAWLRIADGAMPRHEIMQYGARYGHARQALLGLLASLMPDTWFPADEILEMLRDQDVDFLFGDHSTVQSSSGSWYYSRTSFYFSGSRETILGQFAKAETEFVTTSLTGFLFELGLVDLGYEDGRWQSVRLSPAGRGVLNQGAQTAPDSPPTEPGGKVIAQPNFQVLAIGPVTLDRLARLDLFAHRERADRGAFEYRLSRESVYQAQRLGLDVGEMERFLVEVSGGELPQNVRRSMEEWAAQHERIVFRTGVSLLQAANARLLDELLANPQTGEHLARPVGPKVALLKQNSQSPVIAALVAQGLLPVVSAAQPEAADHTVIVAEDGVIRPIHAIPSLHLHGRLASIADPAEDGTWRLTPESVRRAGGSKSAVVRLLDELGRLHRGTLPTRLVQEIQAWGGYYGQAAAETMTLIEFRDLETLEEIRKHPELRTSLTPFSAGHRALAVVRGDRLTEVKEILARLGVRVKEGLKG